MEELIIYFGEKLQDHQVDIPTVVLSRDELMPEMKILKEQFGFIVLLDICGVDNLNRKEYSAEKRFEVVYHLLNMETFSRLRVKVLIGDDHLMPSVQEIWKGATWYERETWDMFGIKFDGVAQERLLNHHQFVGHPMRKDYKTSSNQQLDAPSTHDDGQWVDIGPVGPVTSETFRVMVQTRGDVISDTRLEIGYLHRGIEKLSETFSYQQITPLAERLNSNSAALNSLGWCKAVEDFYGIEISERAQALRMIFAEIGRLVDHFFSIGKLAANLGAVSEYSFCLTQRERLLALVESFTGARITSSLNRIGGLAYDIPFRWVYDCMATLKVLSKSIDRLHKVLSRSKLWMERVSVGTVSKEEALEWGYSGPVLRACGINFDIRKHAPYYFYKDVDFEIPLGINGDGYDRYLVRMEEMRQSIKIVSQLIEHIPSGDILTDYDQGKQPLAEELYSSTEAANGELGFYIVKSGDFSPYRLKVRSPSFALMQSMATVSTNLILSDIPALFSSFNIVAGELDR